MNYNEIELMTKWDSAVPSALREMSSVNFSGKIPKESGGQGRNYVFPSDLFLLIIFLSVSFAFSFKNCGKLWIHFTCDCLIQALSRSTRRLIAEFELSLHQFQAQLVHTCRTQEFVSLKFMHDVFFLLKYKWKISKKSMTKQTNREKEVSTSI